MQSLLQLLDVMLGLDLDAVAAESVDGVLGQILIKHGEDLWSDIVDGYLDQRNQRGVEFLEILVTQIEKLGCKLDAGCCVVLEKYGRHMADIQREKGLTTTAHNCEIQNLLPQLL